MLPWLHHAVLADKCNVWQPMVSKLKMLLGKWAVDEITHAKIQTEFLCRIKYLFDTNVQKAGL